MMAVKKLVSMIMNHTLILFLFLSMIKICIASLNVNDARNCKKKERAELFEVIKTEKIDVIFI